MTTPAARFWVRVAALVLVSCAAAMTVSAAPVERDARPDRIDLEFARVDAIHSVAGPGGMVHCRVAYAVSCRPVVRTPGNWRCAYFERGLAGAGKKQAIIALRDGRWTWVNGDPGHCSLMVIE